MMKRTLERLYKAGRLTKGGLYFYVEKGLITPEDYKDITGEDVPEVKGAKK